MLFAAWNGWPSTWYGAVLRCRPHPLEQHHRDIHPTLARRDHPLAKTVEELLVEPIQVELRLPVGRLSRPRALPRLRHHAQVVVGRCRVGAELLPSPQPNEVVAALLQEVQILTEVHALGLVTAGLPRPDPVLQVVPDVRTGQIHRSPVSITGHGEVTGVDLRDHQRPGGGPRRAARFILIRAIASPPAIDRRTSYQCGDAQAATTFRTTSTSVRR